MRLIRRIRGASRAAATGVARLLACVCILVTIVGHLKAIRRASAILLYPDGGFGHTLLGPDWLRRLYPAEGNLTFFGTSYDHRRHNRLITELWKADRFIWVRQGIMLPRLGAVYDSRWSYRLFGAARRFVKWYVPNTPCHCGIDDLIAATPQPAWIAPGSPFNGRYERRYYPLRQARAAPALRVGEPIRARVSRRLQDRFGSDFPRSCALYVRHRGIADSADTSSINRLSAPLDAYLPAIRVLNRAGYRVLLTGDVMAPPAMVAEREGGLVDWRAAGIDRDAFNLFAGTEVDLHVGSLSGGSAFVFVTDIPALMLNAFAPGDAMPQTTVAYKWLYRRDGTPVELTDLLGGMFYDHQLHGCRLVDNTPEEMAETVADFIAHLAERPYGVDPAELGIDAPWIRAADGRLSPVWLRQYGERAQTDPEQRVATR